MEYRHREIIKKYTPRLQQTIDLFAMKESLCRSKIFTIMMIQDIFVVEGLFFEELPTRGPDAFYHFIQLLETNGYKTIAEELVHVSNPAYHIPDLHGFFFILVNCDSEGIVSPEELEEIYAGSIAESKELELALKTIGYEVYKVRTNSGSNEIRSLLKELSKKDFSNVNSIIVIFLGFTAKLSNSEVICVADGEYISLPEILNLFSDTNVPSLKNKPKIFLLSSFDISLEDSIESVEVLPDVNDTFLWYLPSVDKYTLVKENEAKYFGEILSQNLKNSYRESDFETIFKSSYKKYNNQFPKEYVNFPEYERLGISREKICLY